MIPIEIEDIDKHQKEEIRKIEHLKYFHGTRCEEICKRAYYDINGKCKRVDEITYEEYLSDPREDIFAMGLRGVWSDETL